MNDSAYKHAFTVLTPTHNRAHTLHRVYESLNAQTLRDFEWLVVDDGSIDNTANIIREWSTQASFPIRYYYQSNSGKHVALNRALPLALGKLTLIADSDDSFVPNTLERFLFHWDSVPKDQQEQFCGVTCLVQDESGQQIGGKYPFDPTDSSLLEVFYRYGVRQEQWSLYRTDVLRAFPFPEVSGEKFVLEGVVWFKIAAKYKTRFVNETLRTYFQGASDQLSSNRLPKAHTLTSIYFAQVLNEHHPWFRYAPLFFLRSAVVYAHFSFLSGNSWGSQWRKLASPIGRLLWLAGVTPGYLLAKRDVWRDGNGCH